MSRAEITSEINDLVKQGNVRDAYAKFEELPVIDQIGISLSPGVGDALAVYEVGEFGQRAKESFKEGRTLGGLGYSALSGLSGASLFPLFRILRGGRGAAKALTKTAEDTLDVTPVKEVAPAVTSPVQQLPPDVRSARRVGPKKPKPPKPIPYDKFEPVEMISELDYPGTRYGTLTKGLISGARVALNTENLPNELPLNQWTKKLLGFGNVKKSELQALDFIDELGNPHPKAIEYFSDLLGTTNRGADAPISKKGIDNYLSERQTSLFDIRRAPESEWPDGSTIEGANEEIQKVYRARGILSGAGRTGDDHFNKYYENVALFDYTTEVFPKQFSRVLKEYATDSSFSISTILDDPRISMQFTSNELLELQTKAPSVIPELYAKFVRAHKKLGIPEVSEIADFAKQIDEVSLDRVNRELSDSYVSIKRAQSDYAEDIAKGKGYFDMSSYKERGLSWPTFLEDNMKDPITGEFKLVSEKFLSIDDTIKRRNDLVKVLMDFKNKTPANASKRSKIAKEINEIDTALIDESLSPDGVLDFNNFDSGISFRSKENVSQILQELRQDFLSRTPTQRRVLMMRRYDTMEELKDLPYDAKNKLARDVTLLQYMRGARDPRYVKAAKLYPSELKPSSVTPKAKSVDLPDVDAPYKKDFFENKGRPVLNPLALRKNVLDAVAEGKAGIHIDYMQPIKEGGDNEIVMAQYKEMTKTLRKILQELKVKDDVFELSMPNTGNFEDSGKFAFAGDTDVGAGAYYTFTPEFLAAVKEKGINAFVDGGPVDDDLPDVGSITPIGPFTKPFLKPDLIYGDPVIKKLKKAFNFLGDVKEFVLPTPKVTDPLSLIDYVTSSSPPAIAGKTVVKGLSKIDLDGEDVDELVEWVASSKTQGAKDRIRNLLNGNFYSKRNVSKEKNPIKNTTQKYLKENNLVDKNGNVHLYRYLNIHESKTLQPDQGLSSLTLNPNHAKEMAYKQANVKGSQLKAGEKADIFDSMDPFAGSKYETTTMYRKPVVLEYMVPAEKIDAYLPAVFNSLDDASISKYSAFNADNRFSNLIDELVEDGDEYYDAVDSIGKQYGVDDFYDALDTVKKESEALVDLTNIKPKNIYTESLEIDQIANNPLIEKLEFNAGGPVSIDNMLSAL